MMREHELGVTGEVAGVQRRVGAHDRDRVVDLDVEVVDRQRQVRHEPRLNDDAVRVRIRRLGFQFEVAALQEVVLASGAVQTRPASRVVEHRRRHAARDTGIARGFAGRADQIRTARIARQVEQVEALRREQLHDVRRPNRALIAAAEADVLHGRPVRADLVCVARDRIVVGVAIRQLQRRAGPRTACPAPAARAASVNMSSTLVEPDSPIVAPPAPDSRSCDVGSSVTFFRRS